MENLIAALIQAKKEFGAVKKDGKNPYFKSSYATLESVLKAVEKPLLDNNLILVQKVQFDESADKSYIVSLIYHSSGEVLESGRYYLPASVENDAQKKGASISYARRYSIQSLLCLSAEDDDGNSASGSEKKSPFPFKGQSEAIEWASRKLGSQEKAEMLMEQAVPDEQGRKAPDFLRKVQAKVNQIENEY